MNLTILAYLRALCDVESIVEVDAGGLRSVCSSICVYLQGCALVVPANFINRCSQTSYLRRRAELGVADGLRGPTCARRARDLCDEGRVIAIHFLRSSPCPTRGRRARCAGVELDTVALLMKLDVTKAQLDGAEQQQRAHRASPPLAAPDLRAGIASAALSGAQITTNRGRRLLRPILREQERAICGDCA